jgi:hypothetical protein
LGPATGRRNQFAGFLAEPRRWKEQSFSVLVPLIFIVEQPNEKRKLCQGGRIKKIGGFLAERASVSQRRQEGTAKKKYPAPGHPPYPSLTTIVN